MPAHVEIARLAKAVDETSAPPPASGDRRKLVCLALGVAALLVSLLLPPPAGMKPEAVRTLVVMAVTVLWWATETFPIAITALMAPVMLHALHIVPLSDAVKDGFGSEVVPFTLGVLGLSAAFNASGLAKRFMYPLLRLAGGSAAMAIGVFLWVSFGISMFMDDIAVVVIMLPMALELIRAVDARKGSNFGKGLMLALIFGAILGGVATPAGVSANLITLSFLARNADRHVSFLYWTAISTPIFAAIAAITWWLILRLFPPELKHLPFTRDAMRTELDKLGRWTAGEKTTAAVSLAAVALWLTSDWTKLPTAFVSLLILGGICLPSVGVFRKWKDLGKQIEWGGLLLLIGGLIVGAAAFRSGLAAWVVHAALYKMAAIPRFLQPAAVVVLVSVDSLGLASFGTTASVNVPFVIAYAQQNGLPVLALTLSAAYASSVHCILVTQTPSISVPFAYGYFSVKDLAKIGILVTAVSAILTSAGMMLAGMPG
jgi:solute carrier family 13 (sodium-dependent dicarboxylate transporter), member 2/3/5